MTKDNALLGKFQLDGIPPLPRGVPQISVAFEIDANGILNVNAQEKSTGKAQHITITNEKGRLSRADIERMVSEAAKFREQDEAARDTVTARNELEQYCYSLRQSLDDSLKDAVPAEDAEEIR